MFSCACSLRSTQCAALIALATAAGISRFEPAKSTLANERGTDTRSAVANDEAVQMRLSYFRAALNALAPWFRLFEPNVVASTWVAPSACDREHRDHGDCSGVGQHAPCPAARTSLSTLVREPAASPFTFFSGCAPVPSARKHSFPFAVGPPPDTLAANRRVVGTAVPGDSAARRRLVEESAADSLVAACVALAPSLRPKLDGPLSNPSFAVLGESGLSTAFEPFVASRADVNFRHFLS